MARKRRNKNFFFFVIALSSISCFCQQAQRSTRDSAPVPVLGAANHQDTSETISAVEFAFNFSESSPNAVEPELNGTLVPASQPSRGVTPQPFFGRRNDIGIFAFGNFNPVTPITIRNTPHLAISSNKSSVGGSAEYRHWISAHNALGILYSQNPSDGKLVWQGQNYIWPQMRRDVSLLATQQIAIGRFLSFIDEGPGAVVTNGYGNCGWSAGFALVGGVGTDYQLSRQFSMRTGVTFLETKSGCYDDHTCRETWGVVKDLRVGLVYKWGREGARFPVR
jgi:hypothetical protein